jgi:hypothetical protein
MPAPIAAEAHLPLTPFWDHNQSIYFSKGSSAVSSAVRMLSIGAIKNMENEGDIPS